MPWYSGSTLLAALTALRINHRRSHAENATKSLRVAIQRVFRVYGAGTVATGRVERGTLRVGQQVVIAPRGLKATVTSIESHYVAKQQAGPGENVGFVLEGVARSDVHSGDVVGDAEDNPPKAVKSFLVHMSVTNQPHGIREGAVHILDCHSAHVPVKLRKIHSRLMGKDGTSKDLKVVDVVPKSVIQPLESTPTRERGGPAGALKACVVEPSKQSLYFGRFALRSHDTTLASGTIKSVVHAA
eukprot:CAMPEP_0167803428 /NCGR_PEP_ID=MMETSP0111_2-20121227/19816_1 /TAXON_ID=91324 /ORGANISM="Lotharella globosa, Strain CCCM811" /LENGTH=242 /DNA_ID=CAMNT_0007699867 /DNA_START=307 /DNA_END=1036 /DNA_ORIENTATION=-